MVPWKPIAGVQTALEVLRRNRIALVVSLTLALFALLLLVLFAPRTTDYVVEARTEYLFLSDFDPNTLWRIDGFTLCQIEQDSMFAATPDTCAAVDLPPEPTLTIDPRTEASFKRLGKGELQIQLEGHPPPKSDKGPDSHPATIEPGSTQTDTSAPPNGSGPAANEPAASASDAKPTAILESFGGDGPAPREFYGTIVLHRSDSSGMLPLEFGARAIIGQVPATGTDGLLLGGTVSVFESSLFNAGRFEVETVRLVLGDAVSADAACPKNFRMRGLVRFAPPDKEGLHVTYAGDPGRHNRLVIDRMRARYNIGIPWTASFLIDPLAAVLVAIFGLIATFSGAVAFFLEAGARNGTSEDKTRKSS